MVSSNTGVHAPRLGTVTELQPQSPQVAPKPPRTEGAQIVQFLNALGGLSSAAVGAYKTFSGIRREERLKRDLPKVFNAEVDNLKPPRLESREGYNFAWRRWAARIGGDFDPATLDVPNGDISTALMQWVGDKADKDGAGDFGRAELLRLVTRRTQSYNHAEAAVQRKTEIDNAALSVANAGIADSIEAFQEQFADWLNLPQVAKIPDAQKYLPLINAVKANARLGQPDRAKALYAMLKGEKPALAADVLPILRAEIDDAQRKTAIRASELLRDGYAQEIRQAASPKELDKVAAKYNTDADNDTLMERHQHSLSILRSQRSGQFLAEAKGRWENEIGGAALQGQMTQKRLVDDSEALVKAGILTWDDVWRKGRELGAGIRLRQMKDFAAQSNGPLTSRHDDAMLSNMRDAGYIQGAATFPGGGNVVVEQVIDANAASAYAAGKGRTPKQLAQVIQAGIASPDPDIARQAMMDYGMFLLRPGSRIDAHFGSAPENARVRIAAMRHIMETHPKETKQPSLAYMQTVVDAAWQVKPIDMTQKNAIEELYGKEAAGRPFAALPEAALKSLQDSFPRGFFGGGMKIAVPPATILRRYKDMVTGRYEALRGSGEGVSLAKQKAEASAAQALPGVVTLTRWNGRGEWIENLPGGPPNLDDRVAGALTKLPGGPVWEEAVDIVDDLQKDYLPEWREGPDGGYFVFVQREEPYGTFHFPIRGRLQEYRMRYEDAAAVPVGKERAAQAMTETGGGTLALRPASEDMIMKAIQLHRKPGVPDADAKAGAEDWLNARGLTAAYEVETEE